MTTKKFLVLVISYCLLVVALSGCATAPRQPGALPAYHINGTVYYPLIALCNLKNINWQYDTFTRAVTLTKDTHRINLRVGDSLVLVDGKPWQVGSPIEIYQGAIAVPHKFKEQVLDSLFKPTILPPKVATCILKIRKVVIDAGHGGNDPGAIGRSGLREKDVNLDIAKRLANILRAQGIDAVLTRSTDKFIPLARRVDVAPVRCRGELRDSLQFPRALGAIVHFQHPAQDGRGLERPLLIAIRDYRSPGGIQRRVP